MSNIDRILGSIMLILGMILTFALPLVLTIAETYFLIRTVKKMRKITDREKHIFFVIDITTVFLAIVLELFFSGNLRCELWR